MIDDLFVDDDLITALTRVDLSKVWFVLLVVEEEKIVFYLWCVISLHFFLS